MKPLFARAALVAALMLVPAFALSQEKRTLPATATSTPPRIDGDLSDAVWATAPKATGFIDVASGTPAEEQTTVSILYDEKYIYVAFDCKDSRPEAIAARETVRDSKYQSRGDENTEDNVEIAFDPFLTHAGKDLSRFSVNPLGTRSASFAGGRGAKAEWTSEWEAAAKRTPAGWTAEIRIPWSSLNYPTDREKINIGINFYRYQDRTKRVQEWSRMGLQRFQENEGIWTDVRVPRSAFHPKLSLLPYVLAGYREGRFPANAGVDMRYPITPQLTAVGSINPDFSNLEAAIQTVAFLHTEEFLPEYRPFFLEGGENFTVPWGANSFSELFYSPRVPKFDLGTKLYGKITPRDTIGVLDTYNYNGRNDAVFRYLRNYSDTSSGGFMMIGKDSPGDANHVSAVDNHFRWGKLSFDNLLATSEGKDAGGHMGVGSIYYGDKIVTTILHYSAASRNFRDADGFIPLIDYQGYWYTNFIRYEWKHGYFSGAQIVLNAQDFRHLNNTPFDKEYTSRYQFFTRNDWMFSVDHQDVTFEGLHDRMVGGTVTKGYHNRFQTISLGFSTGETGDVPTTLLVPEVRLRVLKKLDVLYRGIVQYRAGTQQLHIATLNYELSPTRSFGGRVVNRNTDLNAYLFYRNSGGRGTEYFVILGDPNARRTVKSLQVKAVFAL